MPVALLRVSNDGFEIVVSVDEFVTIKNYINEALEALGEDFAVRVGATRREATELLHFLLDERERLTESQG